MQPVYLVKDHIDIDFSLLELIDVTITRYSILKHKKTSNKYKGLRLQH